MFHIIENTSLLSISVIPHQDALGKTSLGCLAKPSN